MLEKESVSVLALFYPHDLPRIAFTGHWPRLSRYRPRPPRRLPIRRKLAGIWRFLLTAGSISSHSVGTGHYPLALRSAPLAPHPTIAGFRRRCHAPSWARHSPPGGSQHATTCYVFRFRQKFGELLFRSKFIFSRRFRRFLS